MICCPHCGKELSTTPVVNTINAAAVAGCQPTWQGTFVWNSANAVQPPYITVCAAVGDANPVTFQIIKL